MAGNLPSKFIIGSLITLFCLFLLAQIILSSALTLGSKTLPKEKKSKVTAVERIQPIGQVYIGDAFVVPQQIVEIDEDISSGQKITTAVCSRCHGSGLMKSPKIGKEKDWTARLKKGKATLYANAINGINKMPARGGKKSLSDSDVKAAVDHMLASLK